MTWDELVELAGTFGPVEERRSRYSDKPALFLDNREIAHCDGGSVDLRVTAKGWKTVKAAWSERVFDVRKDWVSVNLSEDLAELIRTTVENN